MSRNLEDLIRERQDYLRGRPLNWRDRLGDRIRHFDWGFAAFTFCVVGWGACQIFIAVVRLMEMSP